MTNKKSSDLSRAELIQIIQELRGYASELQSTLASCHTELSDAIGKSLNHSDFIIDEPESNLIRDAIEKLMRESPPPIIAREYGSYDEEDAAIESRGYISSWYRAKLKNILALIPKGSSEK